ncbi:MAG: type II toxin-antitoxin system Phd/YefM family antitoxin [Thermaerobacter sp.]|nr:type II toxin-antitoxin system Phd/YefM family antitoxin [Thermaerobacter sp.]
MKGQWQLQEAKNKLSQLVDQAEHEPQVITVRGIPKVVVVSVRDYHVLTRPQTTLVEFFQESPLNGVGLDLSRRSDTSRTIDL